MMVARGSARTARPCPGHPGLDERRELYVVRRGIRCREREQAPALGDDRVAVALAERLEHLDDQPGRTAGPGPPPHSDDEAVDEHGSGEDPVPGEDPLAAPLPPDA